MNDLNTQTILVGFVIIFIFFVITGRLILPRINKKDKKILIDKKIKNKVNHITQNFFKLPDDATFNDLIELTTKIEKSELDQNSIDMIKGIRNQVICKNNTSCYYCGKEINFVTGRHCSYCNLLVCTDHILPEKHGCRGNRSPEGGRIIYKANGKWSPRR